MGAGQSGVCCGLWFMLWWALVAIILPYAAFHSAVSILLKSSPFVFCHVAGTSNDVIISLEVVSVVLLNVFSQALGQLRYNVHFGLLIRLANAYFLWLISCVYVFKIVRLCMPPGIISRHIEIYVLPRQNQSHTDRFLTILSLFLLTYSRLQDCISLETLLVKVIRSMCFVNPNLRCTLIGFLLS